MGSGRFTADDDAILMYATTVPFWSLKTLGSTVTLMVAGVLPLYADKLIPETVGEREKSVFAPPGSTIEICWVDVLRSQKLPRKTRSGCEACTRFTWFMYPTGRTVT